MAAMSSAVRPLDFVVINRYGANGGLSLNALEQGAVQARMRFPKTNSLWSDASWVSKSEVEASIESSIAESDQQRQSIIDGFVNSEFDPSHEVPIKQLFIKEPGGNSTLVTRMHHAAGDLLSLVMWLETQFGGTHYQSSSENLEFKTSGTRVGKSRYSSKGPSQSLWAHNSRPSSRRSWTTLRFSAGHLRDLAARAGKFTYNDILCTAALESAYVWNDRHNRTPRTVSVWLPVNVRKEALKDFGNGTSRIRVYSKGHDLSFVEQCALTREQVNWSKANGEWAFPTEPLIAKLPAKISKGILQAYFNRPWVDMGTILFSHAEKITDGAALSLATGLEHMEVIANLHRQYPLGIAGTTYQNTTTLTFTYDPALLNPDEVDEFVEIYQNLLRDLPA